MNTLPSRVHDSQNGLNYTLVENYYLPDLEIESGQPIGKFGRARMKYLKEYRPGLYSRLLLSGKLYDDLNEVDAGTVKYYAQILECFFHAGFPPTITLNNRCFKGNSLEPRHMELNLPGGCHEIAIIMTAPITLPLFAAFITSSLCQLLRFCFQQAI